MFLSASPFPPPCTTTRRLVHHANDPAKVLASRFSWTREPRRQVNNSSSWAQPLSRLTSPRLLRTTFSPPTAAASAAAATLYPAFHHQNWISGLNPSRVNNSSHLSLRIIREVIICFARHSPPSGENTIDSLICQQMHALQYWLIIIYKAAASLRTLLSYRSTYFSWTR